MPFDEEELDPHGECAAEIHRLRAQIFKLRDAVVWCSGSDDFQPGGKAREGWEKICQPLLSD